MPFSPRRVSRITTVLATVSVAFTTALSAASQAATPPGPAVVADGIEQPQPYVGQSTCDPVDKPGVVAFSAMVVRTYPSTRSWGISRDCALGGQSEHKEGRAWDWAASAANPQQAADVDALLGWLLAPDAAGNQAAMARRLGIMYIIWNGRIWGSYAMGAGWRPYNGPSPHSDHVHFSFGWSGAKQATSYWTGRVAAVDLGPSGPGSPPIGNYDAVTTTATSTTVVGWAADLDSSGPVDVRVDAAGTSRVSRADQQRPDVAAVYPRLGSAHGFSVPLDDLPDGVQNVCVTALNAPGTGGSPTTLGCRTITIRHGATGYLDAVSTSGAGTVVAGWALDQDIPGPVRVQVTVDGVPRQSDAVLPRPDVAATFPGTGLAHGFRVQLDDVPDGQRTICVTALNAVGTVGRPADLGCRTLQVRHDPAGFVDTARPVRGGIRVAGWAGEAGSAGSTTVVVSVAGSPVAELAAAGARPDVPAAMPWLNASTGFSAVLPLPGVPEGEQRICLTARNLGAGRDRPLGCRPVLVQHDPVGFLDLVEVRPTGVAVAGWALDPDLAGAAQVRISTSYGQVLTVAATSDRPDVASAFPYGPAAGFVATIPKAVPDGVQTVCADVVNAGAGGSDRRLGCRQVFISHAPVGMLDAVSPGPAGTVRARGWAADPDLAGAIDVHFYVDGRYAGKAPAGGSRPDVAAAWPMLGAGHGFDAVLAVPAGAQRLCAFAIGAGEVPTTNPQLGCAPVRPS